MKISADSLNATLEALRQHQPDHGSGLLDAKSSHESLLDQFRPEVDVNQSNVAEDLLLKDLWQDDKLLVSAEGVPVQNNLDNTSWVNALVDYVLAPE